MVYGHQLRVPFDMGIALSLRPRLDLPDSRNVVSHVQRNFHHRQLHRNGTLQDWVSAAELLEDNIDKAEGYANAAKQMHMLFLKAMKTDWSAQSDRNRYAELACEYDEENCEFYWTDNLLDRYRW